MKDYKVGILIKDRLRELNLSVTELADNVGLSAPTVYSIIQGKSYKLDSLKKVEQGLRLPDNSLSNLNEEMEKEIDIETYSISCNVITELLKQKETKISKNMIIILINKLYDNIINRDLKNKNREIIETYAMGILDSTINN